MSTQVASLEILFGLNVTGAVASARQLGDAVDGASAVSTVSMRRLEDQTERMIKSLDREAATAGKTKQEILALKVETLAAANTGTGMTEAAERLTAAYGRQAAAAGQVDHAHQSMGASGMILQHVVRSTSDSFAAGLPPSMIFAEQIGRLGEAAALSGGAMGAFGAVLSGPWGIAITAGVSLLATFVPKLLSEGEASDAAGEAHKRHARAALTLTDAVEQLNQASTADIRTESVRIKQSAATVLTLGNEEIATRRLIKARLEDAIAQARQAAASNVPGTPSYVGAGARELATQGYVNGLQAQYDAAGKALEAAERGLRSASSYLIRQDVAGELDKVAGATTRYTREVRTLTEEHDSGRMSSDKYRAEVRAAAEALEVVKNADKTAAAATREHKKELSEQAKAHREAAKAAAEHAKYELQLTQDLGKEQAALDAKYGKDVDVKFSSSLASSEKQLERELAGAGKIKNTFDEADKQMLDTAQQFADIIGGGFGQAISQMLPMLDKATKVFESGSALEKTMASFGLGSSAASMTGGSKLGGGVGGVIGGDLGSVYGPLGEAAGSIAGGILGGVIGGLFKSVKKASDTIELISGQAMITSVNGNSSKLKAAAGTMANSLISGLTDIADQLGGALGDDLKVSIGQRKKKFTVDLTGQGRTKGVASFGTEEEAVAYAVQNLIQQGAITGLRAGAETLLKGQGDLEAQMKKALSFQSVFDELKQRTDPVGYAMDQIAKEFTALNKVFAEAGASADDYAQLQQLRTLKEAEAQAQAAKADEDTSERLGLERQLLEAQGDTAALRKLDLDALLPANRALQERIWAIQDEQAATAAATQAAQEAAAAAAQAAEAETQRLAAIASQRDNLNRQLLQAAGDEAAIRALDLAALDEALRPIQEHIYALNDQAAATAAAAQAAQAAAQVEDQIANQREQLQGQLWSLQGNVAAQRAAELAKITDPMSLTLQRAIYAETDRQAAAAAATAEAEKAAQAADQLRQAWASIADGILEEVQRIRGEGLTGTQSYAVLLGQFNTATLAARAGDQDAAKGLTSLSKSLLDAAAGVATSQQELSRIQAMTASSLEDTYGVITGSTSAAAVSLGSSGTSWTPQVIATGSSGSDPNAEVRSLREEVKSMSDRLIYALATIAGNTQATARTLDNATRQTGGDAFTVEVRAA